LFTKVKNAAGPLDFDVAKTERYPHSC